MAWYDSDSETPLRNPFQKFRLQQRRTNSSNLERGLEPVRPLTPPIPAGPRTVDDYSPHELSHIYSTTTETADTMNPGSMISSTEPINVSSRDTDASLAGLNKPRRRRTQNMDESADGSSDMVPDVENESIKKPRFTVASQLRATLLNSWINILLVAAPVGSKYWTFQRNLSVCEYLLSSTSCFELCSR